MGPAYSEKMPEVLAPKDNILKTDSQVRIEENKGKTATFQFPQENIF